nr:putative reverse transcriptase domain-containing protein [Tanacetum cinerariifolium]
MVAFAIIISSDSSDDSVGSRPYRVILFGDIPTVIPSTSVIAPETSCISPVISSITPVVETTLVASPTELCGLVPYSDSDFDSPDEMDSPEYITSSKVTACSSSPSDFPIAPVTASSGIRRRAAILIRLGEAIPLESSSGDSSERPLHSSSHSAGPSCKRCRSLADSVPSSTPVTGSLAPTHVDLLPPRKRLRDSYSSKTSMEDDTKINTTKTEDGKELDIVDADDVRDHIEVDLRDDREDFEAVLEIRLCWGLIQGQSVEDIPVDLDGAIRDFYHHMSEVRVDRIVGIETTQRQLEADQIDSKARAGMAESIRSLRSKNLKIRDDRDDLRRKLRRTMTNTRSGMTPVAVEEMINRCVAEALEAHEINRNRRLESLNGNHNNRIGIGNGGNGNDGVKRWKQCFTSATVRNDTRNEIQKMETELWNFSVKNNDMANYTQRFQELTMMCTKMVLEEEDRVEKFIGGLPDNLMDKKLKGYAVKNAENKKKFDTNHRDNHGQQPPFKRQNTRGQNVARAYTAGNNRKRDYGGTLPYCNRCKLHHEGQCIVKCHNCGRIRHMARDCRSFMAVTTQGTPGPNQRVVTCFECGAQGHYRKDCPKVKNQNHGNKARVPNVRGKAYFLGGGDCNTPKFWRQRNEFVKQVDGNGAMNSPQNDANPGSNTVTGTFLLNDHHAYMLFDSGADRSFVSNNFSTLLDITPSALDVSYAVELADERTSETSTVLKGCTLGLLGHPFNIDLMPIDLGSFDFIIGMDWLAKNHAVIVCNEKIVRIPYGNEILIVQGDKSDEKKSMLSIISCVKARKYMEKGCQLFLAYVTVKDYKDKSKEKRLEDVPTVRDFPEVFPEDLHRLPPIRKVEFQINLVPGAAPVARASYRLTPSEMQELSTQLQELSDKGFLSPSSSPWGASVLFVKRKMDPFGCVSITMN